MQTTWEDSRCAKQQIAVHSNFLGCLNKESLNGIYRNFKWNSCWQSESHSQWTKPGHNQYLNNKWRRVKFKGSGSEVTNPVRVNSDFLGVQRLIFVLFIRQCFLFMHWVRFLNYSLHCNMNKYTNYFYPCMKISNPSIIERESQKCCQADVLLIMSVTSSMYLL